MIKYSPELYFSSSPEVLEWWNPKKSDNRLIYQDAISFLTHEMAKVKGGKILDAACGKGRAAEALHIEGHKSITLIDINPWMLDEAQRKLPNSECVLGNIESLPFENESFKGIVCIESLVHVDDLTKVFFEFERVLETDGVYVISIDRKYGAMRVTKDFLEILYGFFDKKFRERRIERRTRFRTLTNKEVINTAKTCGLKINLVQYYGSITPMKINKFPLLSYKRYKLLHKISRKLDQTPFGQLFASYSYFSGTKI